MIGVLGLATRDLATRAAPMRISGFQMSAWAFGLMAPTGLAMMWVMGSRAVWPEGLQLAYLACTLIIGVIAYYMVVAAMRVGDIPVVTPFRYTRMVFALFVALLVFWRTPGHADLYRRRDYRGGWPVYPVAGNAPPFPWARQTGIASATNLPAHRDRA